MSLALVRSGEDVSAFGIGIFGDIRLAKIGALFFKRLSEKLTVSIKSLGGNRATEIAFHRFLENDNVKPSIIIDEFSRKTNDNCANKEHVLCIQDTVQLTYPTQENKKVDFGSTSDPNTKGLFVHPGVIVDADNRDILGASSIISWSRDEKLNNKRNKSRTIEEKESIRWVNTALAAKQTITNAKMITVIGDRESDILEIFQRIPDKSTHLIVRAAKDRNLATDEKISELLNDKEVMGIHEIDLPAITGKRIARTAKLTIKFTELLLRSSNNDEPIKIHCVVATEISNGAVSTKENPISWVLLTTHKVNSLKSAIQILTWYTWRWIIEQVFRTMKNKGLKIEDSQIEDPKKLQILSILSVVTAIKIMSLVESRNGNNNRKAKELFNDNELILLFLICKKLEGATKKQKNSYIRNSLSWAAWIIARLGGWNGYKSESPPGPITMLRGIRNFELQYEGWILAQ